MSKTSTDGDRLVAGVDTMALADELSLDGYRDPRVSCGFQSWVKLKDEESSSDAEPMLIFCPSRSSERLRRVSSRYLFRRK